MTISSDREFWQERSYREEDAYRVLDILKDGIREIKNPIFFEVGSLDGNLAELFAREFSGKGFVFEPSPTNYKWVLEKWEGTKTDLTVENVALDGKDGMKTLYHYPEHPTGHSFRSQKWRPEEKIEVPTKTISTLMKEYKLDHIDVLHMDCEGAEFSIVENIVEEALMTKIKNMAIRLHGETKEEDESLIKRLSNFYSVIDLERSFMLFRLMVPNEDYLPYFM